MLLQIALSTVQLVVRLCAMYIDVKVLRVYVVVILPLNVKRSIVWLLYIVALCSRDPERARTNDAQCIRMRAEGPRWRRRGPDGIWWRSSGHTHTHTHRQSGRHRLELSALKRFYYYYYWYRTLCYLCEAFVAVVLAATHTLRVWDRRVAKQKWGRAKLNNFEWAIIFRYWK